MVRCSKLKKWVNYPAIFTFEDDGISVRFPDVVGCFTCGSTVEESVKNAKEALGLHLYGMEEDSEVFPTTTDIKDIKTDKNESLVIIEVYMPAYRDNIKNTSIKKTLTIPKWLNDLGEENNVNFSRILQEGLKEYLGIK